METCSYEECLNTLIVKFKHPLITLIFVDETNIMRIRDILLQKFPPINGIMWPIHVICSMTNNTSMAHLETLKKRPWFTSFHTEEKVKNAAALLLSTLMMISHMLLPLSTKFLIVSSSQCFDESIQQCTSASRYCSSISNFDYDTLSEHLETIIPIKGYVPSYSILRELLH